MQRTTKKIQGQLLDKDSRMLLSESSISITLIEPQNPNDRPRYEASLTVDGYKPEFDNNSYLLKLSNDLIGEVFISIDGIPGTQTRFKVHLQDSNWSNVEWFKKI
jgi:hypothetical protein